MTDYSNKHQIFNCSHEWKDTLLLISTVTDCVKCKVRKEDWDSKLAKEKEDEDKKITETSWASGKKLTDYNWDDGFTFMCERRL